MYHTIQFPLRVHLCPSAQRKPVHAHRMHDVGEYRLDCPHAPAVEVSSPIGIKAFYHPLRRAYSIVPRTLVDLGHLSDFGREVSQGISLEPDMPCIRFQTL